MPTTQRVLLYRCEFCRRKTYRRRDAIWLHEIHCKLNPMRIPWCGEITSVHQMGSAPALGAEWTSHEAMPIWWQGPGKIWNAEEWVEVAGYEQVTISDGSGSGIPGETWPVVAGKPLNEHRGLDRLLHYFDDTGDALRIARECERNALNLLRTATKRLGRIASLKDLDDDNRAGKDMTGCDV